MHMVLLTVWTFYIPTVQNRMEKVGRNGQEIPQPHSADQTIAQRGRAT